MPSVVEYVHNLAGVRILYNNGKREYTFVYAPEFNKPAENPVIPDIDLPFDIPVEIPEPEEPYDQVVLPQIHHSIMGYGGSAEDWGSAVFTDEALQALILEISEEDANEILAYTEEILGRKDYTPHAKAQIRDTVTQLIWYYPNYQTLFGFLEPMDTKTFICSAFLNVLDESVDHICFPCEHGKASVNYKERTLHLPLTNQAEDNAVNMIYHVTQLSSNVSLSLGMTDLYAMTMIGSFRYYNIGAFYSGSRTLYRDPNAEGRYLTFASGSFSRNGSSYWADMYFRMYVLTDTETMMEYARTANKQVVVDYLKEHYGNDGVKFFNSYDYTDYEHMVKSEKLFLKLLLQRLEEVESQEEMLSYLQLYRVYRKLFCIVYEQIEDVGNQRNTLELDHPELDYRSADALVAQAAYRSGIMREGVLTEAQAMELLTDLIERRQCTDYEDYRDYYHYGLSSDVFLIGDLRYKVYVYPSETIYRVTDHTYGASYTISVPG